MNPPQTVTLAAAPGAITGSGSFTPIAEEVFLQLLVQCVAKLPSNVSIQRVTAGVDNDTLLSPLWCKNKHEQIRHAKEALQKAGFNL